MTNITLLNGCAIECLSNMPVASLDAVITDPPYSSGGSQRKATASKPSRKYTDNKSTLPDFHGETMDQLSLMHFTNLWMQAAYNALVPSGIMAAFIDWRNIAVTDFALQSAGFRKQGILVWDKTEGVRPRRGAFRQQAEFIIWGVKGSLDVSGPILPGLYRHSNIMRDKKHLTQKPLDLMKWLCGIKPAGATICDAFMGSGTTGIAARELKQSFIGIERHTDIFATAEQRLCER